MKCYVIKTSNDKYLRLDFSFNPNAIDDENRSQFILSEESLSKCIIFEEDYLRKFIYGYKGLLEKNSLIFKYDKFELSQIEEVSTIPTTLENLDL